jgi:MtN3 and saliva related transmembrane protein
VVLRACRIGIRRLDRWTKLAAFRIMAISLHTLERHVNIDADLIGYAAATLTTFAFVPQTVKTIRTRETHAISFWMYVAFTIGVALWFFYGVALGSWPIIAANAVSFLLAATILTLKVCYG